ncbi:MAG: hypothetical protein ACKN9T_15060 [Candidatus Methylumidiphilus sp.]
MNSNGWLAYIIRSILAYKAIGGVIGAVILLLIVVTAFAAVKYFPELYKIKIHLNQDGSSIEIARPAGEYSGLPPALGTQEKPRTEQPIQSSKFDINESAKYKKFIEEKARESHKLSQYCKDLPNGYFMYAPKLSENGGKITISFDLYARVNFAVNQYSIESSYPKECIKEIVYYFVGTLKDPPGDSKIKIQEAIFEGGADAVRRHGAKVSKYKGDIENENNISLPASQVKINGEPASIDIRNGEEISNAELAFLRGYFIYHEFLDAAHRNAQDDLYDVLKNSKIHFVATESPSQGSEYRYASVKLVVDMEPLQAQDAKESTSIDP